MHPKIIITIDGKPVSGLFLSRLISVSVEDREGDRSDTIDMELDAGPPFLTIPRKKAIIRAWFGYEESGSEYMGAFTADEITLDCLPYKVKIQGKSADMRDSLKEHQDRHWDQKPASEVFGAIARENGLTLQIAPAIGNVTLPYWNQENESGLHFARRMARRLGGTMVIKDGKMLIVERGAGQTAGGAGLGLLTVTPAMILQGTCSVSFQAREKHAKVRAAYQNTEKAEREYGEASGDAEGTATYTLRHPVGSKEEADRAAEAKAKDLKREADSTSVTIEGNTRARGGAPMVYDGVHPQVDGLPWIIESAKHEYSKGQGYRTAISGKAKS